MAEMAKASGIEIIKWVHGCPIIANWSMLLDVAMPIVAATISLDEEADAHVERTPKWHWYQQ